MRKDSEPVLAKTTFTLAKALGNYEKFTKGYENCARLIVARDDEQESISDLVEVSCGTGNSTLIIAESYRNLKKLTAVEPSSFLELAKYKFGHRIDFPTSEDVVASPEVIKAIENQRNRALRFRNIVDFKKGRTEDLPIDDEIAQRVICCQALHWYTFADTDLEGIDKNYLGASVAEISRILKHGGLFLFDSSGSQFSFGEDKENDKPVDDYHLLKHPFYQKFSYELANLAVKNGADQAAVSQIGRKEKYNGIFDIEFLSAKFAEYGLSFVKTPEGLLYTRQIDPLSKKDFINTILNASFMRMRAAEFPGLKLTDAELNNMVTQAFQNAGGEDSDSLNEPSCEILVQFAAKKD